MEKVKEVWVRFSDIETYYENEGELLSILSSASGDCVVKVYIENIRSCKELCDWSFDKEQLSLLMNVFGEENVRYQEKDIKKEIKWNEQNKVPKIKQIIHCPHNLYAVFENSDGSEHKHKVLLYALCSDGEVYPLFFDDWYGICLSRDAFVCADRYELEGGEVVYMPERGKQNEQG